MAYPENLVEDSDSKFIANELGLAGVGTPVFELYDDDPDQSSYRFASLERRGTVYIRIDQTEK